jgi:hypothetical protein
MAASGSIVRTLVLGAVLFAAGFLLGWWAGAAGGGGAGGGSDDPGGGSARSAAGGGGAADVGAAEEYAVTTGGTPQRGGVADAGPGRGRPGFGGPAGGGTAAGAPGGGADPGSAAGPGRAGKDVTDREGAVAPGGKTAPTKAEGPAYALPEKIAGKLLDARTGKPIPGAAVSLLWSTSDGTQSSSLSIPLKDDGTFAIEPVEAMRAVAEEMFRGEFQRGKFASADEAYRDVEYRIRVAAKGYETFEKGDPGASHEVSLEPEHRDRLYGSVRVDALWPDDSRYAGRLLVNVSSHDRGSWSQWALPEPDGSYVLPGIAAGTWSFNVAGRHNTGTEVAVLEAAESKVTLRVPRRGVEEPPDAPSGEPREVEVALGARDAGAGACMRAEFRPGLFHRVEVLSNRALFPALPPGKWEFVLQAPDLPEVRFAAEVTAGAGRLVLPFPEPGR